MATVNPFIKERLARLEDMKQTLRDFKAKSKRFPDAKEETDFVLDWASKFGLRQKTATEYYTEAKRLLRKEDSEPKD